MYRRSGRSKLLLLVLLVTSAALITLDHRSGAGGVPHRLRRVAQVAVAPLQSGVTAIGQPVGRFVSNLRDLGRSAAEKERLQERLASLEAEAHQARGLLEENEDLRDQLGLSRSWRAAERVTAQVIADAPGNYRWSVVIDRGEVDGVRRDMPVLVPDGLVGKVLDAGDHQATVLLMVDPSAGAAARLEGSGATGAVSGNGVDRPLTLEFVDKGARVVAGDPVVTSHMNRGIFPAGIPIGVVSEVEGDERSTEYDISVEPYVDFKSLQFVQVLLLPPPPLEGIATP